MENVDFLYDRERILSFEFEKMLYSACWTNNREIRAFFLDSVQQIGKMEISSIAMNLFNRFTLSFATFASLLLATPLLVSCDSSSDSSSSEEAGVYIWTLTSEQFNSGLYDINYRSTHGPDIRILPNAGGADGVMSVSGVTTPVNLTYTPIGDADFPSHAIMQLTFAAPEDGSVIRVLEQLGVEVLSVDGATEDAPLALPANSRITFGMTYSRYESVSPDVEASPSTELASVQARWTAHDSESEQQNLSAWVLMDMLQTTFTITAR